MTRCMTAQDDSQCQKWYAILYRPRYPARAAECLRCRFAMSEMVCERYPARAAECLRCRFAMSEMVCDTLSTAISGTGGGVPPLSIRDVRNGMRYFIDRDIRHGRHTVPQCCDIRPRSRKAAFGLFNENIMVRYYIADYRAFFIVMIHVTDHIS